MTTQENPTCDRCGRDGKDHPTNVYDPNTSGYPTKRTNLCDECATKDNKATLITSGKPETVPDITPAVPEQADEVETIEFGPNVPELIVPPVDGQPAIGTPVLISKQAVEEKIAGHEKDLDTLLENRQKLQSQIPPSWQKQNNANENQISIQRVAIAALRDLLGNES